MISDALTVAAIFASGGLLGYIIGAARGRKRGRDEQWVECFLAGERREKARRETDGRFKSKTK
jgi:hypothetical protein|tara:strand:- start:775 stop:963 length:189 start_codon:yes stop_codon:yes gene_type:complete